MVFSPLPPLIPPLSLMEDLPPSLLAANNVTRALAWSCQSNLPKLDTTFSKVKDFNQDIYI